MSEPRHTKDELKYFRALPLDLKIRLTQDRIKAWVNMFGEDGVCVSFSGGKDSTVLLHLVRELYPNVKAVFSNTGLEYPEIRQFAMKHENVDMVHPDMGFVDVITQYGYPLISKEVAEAIYYARRIGGGQSGQRKTGEKGSSGENFISKADGTYGSTKNSSSLQTSCNLPKRSILTGTYIRGGAGAMPTETASTRIRQTQYNSVPTTKESKESIRRKSQFMGSFPRGQEKATRTSGIQTRGDDGEPF